MYVWEEWFSDIVTLLLLFDRVRVGRARDHDLDSDQAEAEAEADAEADADDSQGQGHRTSGSKGKRRSPQWSGFAEQLDFISRLNKVSAGLPHSLYLSRCDVM